MTTQGVEWAAGEGTCVHLWLIHVAVWQKPTQHRKAIILQKFFLKSPWKNQCISF